MTVIVDSWTGGRAAALQQSLRMTNEEFAELLGTAVRTVANWHASPGMVPKQEIQRALDTALGQAPDDVGARFERLTLDQTAPTSSTSAVGVAVVETRLTVDIDIDADGWGSLTYTHELTNRGDQPFSRLTRELWFETTQGPLRLEARAPQDEARNVMIQRVHDTASMTKFACQLLPALKPGESTVVSYSCSGGRFVHDHYWRQSIVRPTDQLTIALHHAGVDALTMCSATEERPDGSVVSADDGLFWHRDASGVLIGLTRRALAPSQAVTLRWGMG